MIQSLRYFAICSETNSPGVAKKIIGFIKGASENNLSSSYSFFEPNGIKNHFKLFNEVIRSKSDINVIRYQGTLSIFVVIAAFLIRIKGRVVILDVPTPIINLIKEVFKKEKFSFKDIIIIVHIFVLGPLIFLFFNRILQYSNESIWFSLFSSKKSMLIGNGINVKSIPFKQKKLDWPSKKIIFVGVGTIGIWHGYDKVIKAIKTLKKMDDFNYKIKFKIIGEGPELNNLKFLVKKLNLENEVIFLGMLFEENLYKEYDNSHFGIGSLGWHRVGVNLASPLKIREYLSAGIPVITATSDPDFFEKFPFYFEVSEGEDYKDFVDLIKKIVKIPYPNSKEVRQFALNRLDFKNKVEKILKLTI